MESRSAWMPTRREVRPRRRNGFSRSWTRWKMTSRPERRRRSSKVSDARLIERLWFSDDAWARAARLALAPFEGIYSAVVRTRGLLYDAGLLRARATAVPAISIGNLSVGGTGKTPVAAWIASELAARGARPA